MPEGQTLRSVNPEAARFYEELGSTRVTGELHNAIGDIYMQYLDIPEKAVPNAEYARLETAYRNYEANNTVANVAAFLDEAGKVQRIAVGKGYNMESPYARMNTAMEGERVGDTELAQAYIDGENLLAQGPMDEIDSERSVGDNSLENIADGYLHGEGKRNAWNNANLVDELAKSGVKYNVEDILAITKTRDGKLVWLETGNSKAGMQHILNHADDFAKKGIQQNQIIDLIMESLTNGKVVGYQGRGRGRPIYEVLFEGKTYYIAITVGDNGFIVGANLTTWS